MGSLSSATINCLPVLLLTKGLLATGVADPSFSTLEHPGFPNVSMNDTFRPVSRFFDRVKRPEQVPDALLGAMRVLAVPAETGSGTICLPRDVQTVARDLPDELFAPRHLAHRPPRTRRHWARPRNYCAPPTSRSS